MTYPDLTGTQAAIIAVAAIVPLVWAFTHHGLTRIITLMLWLPWVLFVGRVIYRNPSPTAPLELRLRWATVDLFGDPMTIAWPVFVLLTFGLIRLFTAPRRRREANTTSQAAIAHASAQTVPAPPDHQSLVAAPGVSPHAPQAHPTTCRHCGTPAASPNARYCAQCGIELGYDPTLRSQKV
jgi:hypothetical protein